ncbi:MAG: HK97 family phage prohead protease [Caloramator sp.]|nr:HK97 family phage prohead protease [Caloramator sp.]
MKIEIRGNQVKLDGYVNVPMRESRILPSPRGPFIEKIEPKVFERALQRADDVELLFNHDKNKKLGSIKEGNLELYEDNIGLRAIATITDEEIVEKAKNNKLKGWSFGFIANEDEWEEGKDGIQRRTIKDLDLIEVSILDKTPAYIATSIEVRNDKSVITEQRNEEFTATVEEIEEKRHKVFDFSIYEKELEIIKLKGGR